MVRLAVRRERWEKNPRRSARTCVCVCVRGASMYCAQRRTRSQSPSARQAHPIFPSPNPPSLQDCPPPLTRCDDNKSWPKNLARTASAERKLTDITPASRSTSDSAVSPEGALSILVTAAGALFTSDLRPSATSGRVKRGAGAHTTSFRESDAPLLRFFFFFFCFHCTPTKKPMLTTTAVGFLSSFWVFERRGQPFA